MDKITFHFNSGKDKSWLITAADFERLLVEFLSGQQPVLRLTTVDDRREVLVDRRRVEAVEFSQAGSPEADGLTLAGAGWGVLWSRRLPDDGVADAPA